MGHGIDEALLPAVTLAARVLRVSVEDVVWTRHRPGLVYAWRNEPSGPMVLVDVDLRALVVDAEVTVGEHIERFEAGERNVDRS